jgi:hypothetical protein
MKCVKCKRGYLVAEYSPSEETTHYYCNYCFKYADESEETPGLEMALIQEAVDASSEWEEISEEELERLLDDIFKDFLKN